MKIDFAHARGEARSWGQGQGGLGEEEEVGRRWPGESGDTGTNCIIAASTHQPSPAQPSPAQPSTAPHRHQDHRRWFKGDTGPGGRGWSTHHSTQPAPVVCWCVGVLVCPRPVCSRCWWWRCVGARHSRPGDWRRPWMLQTLFAAGRGAEKLADWAAAHG